IVRGRFGLKRAVSTLLMAPLIVPHIIFALSLFFYFKEIGLYDTEFGLVLGHSVLILPFIIISVSSSLKGFSQVLEVAAMAMGAGWWRALRLVTLPLIWPGILSGALLAFLASFDELLIALFVTGRLTQTLPKKLFNTAMQEVDPM